MSCQNDSFHKNVRNESLSNQNIQDVEQFKQTGSLPLSISQNDIESTFITTHSQSQYYFTNDYLTNTKQNDYKEMKSTVGQNLNQEILNSNINNSQKPTAQYNSQSNDAFINFSNIYSQNQRYQPNQSNNIGYIPPQYSQEYDYQDDHIQIQIPIQINQHIQEDDGEEIQRGQNGYDYSEVLICSAIIDFVITVLIAFIVVYLIGAVTFLLAYAILTW